MPCRLPAKWPRTGSSSLDGGVAIFWSDESDNTHTLYGDGQVLLVFSMSRQRARWWVMPDNTLAWLTVPQGGEAFLMHSGEHGALGIGPGTYQLLQQREFNAEWGWSTGDD